MVIQTNKRIFGFTLLEILIALLIVSIGLLGVATLLVRGQQFTQVAYLRTQATFLAYDLMDRMRINFPLMVDQRVNATYQVPDFANKRPEGEEIDQPDRTCINQACQPIMLTNNDLDNWFYWLRDIFGYQDEKNIGFNPQAQIIGTDTNSDGIHDNYTITIRWKNIVDNPESEFDSQIWQLDLSGDDD